MVSRSSNAPVFTSPAWEQRSSGPSSASTRRVLGTHPPWSSAGTRAPGRARSRAAAARAWRHLRVSPTTTRSGGAPRDPRCSMSQPTPLEHGVAGGREAGDVRHLAAGHERERRVAAEAQQFSTQRPATSSSDRRGGGGSARPAFWSHARTSQSAASAAGQAPPMTKPKYRPDPIAVRPGSATVASSSMTWAACIDAALGHGTVDVARELVALVGVRAGSAGWRACQGTPPRAPPSARAAPSPSPRASLRSATRLAAQAP